MAEDVQEKKLPRGGTLKGMMSVKCFDSSFSASVFSLLTQRIRSHLRCLFKIGPMQTWFIQLLRKFHSLPYIVEWYRHYLPALALEASGSDPAEPSFKQLDNVHIPNFQLLTFKKKKSTLLKLMSPCYLLWLKKKTPLENKTVGQPLNCLTFKPLCAKVNSLHWSPLHQLEMFYITR